MNISKFTVYILSITMLSSCSIVNNITKSKNKDNSRSEVSLENDKGSTVNSGKSHDSHISYIGINNLEKQLYGEWSILTIYNKKVTTRERAYIHLDFKAHRLYGNNGCNVINGDFTADANKISFSNIITTMAECHNGTSERTVMKTFDETVSFKLYEKNEITYLQFLNSRGNVIMTLRRQNMDFINGAWTVKEINGVPTDDKNMRLVIDTEQLKIHGSTGCNIINGTIYIDTEKNNAIQFQQLISTKKMCADMKTETELLVALEETHYCEQVSADEIKLINHKDEVMVILSRLDLSSDTEK